MKKLFILLFFGILLVSCVRSGTMYSRGVVTQPNGTYLIGVRGEGREHMIAEVKKLAETTCPDYKVVSIQERQIFGKQWKIYLTIECPGKT
jgi:hypothetical protein